MKQLVPYKIVELSVKAIKLLFPKMFQYYLLFRQYLTLTSFTNTLWHANR